MSESGFRYRWHARGDINGFFALSIDNLALLVGMAGILIGVFHMPSSVVLGRMVPGTAFGVLVGDLLYTWLAFRLARRECRQDVTAMPLGIDAPSMFALSFGVVGPAYLASGDADKAWQVGMAVLVVMGAGKLVAAFFGETIRQALPRSALLGAISAVGIALIMFFPFTKIMAEPVGGFLALGLVLLVLVGKARMPWNLPVVIVALLAGLAAAWLASQFGYQPPPLLNATADPGLALPLPSLAFLGGLEMAWNYLPLSVPVALATVIGGIDNTESAAVAGDHYETRSILLVEGCATLVAALCGGVIQNTPYIGHPAYKEMGARAGYTLATGLFIGIGAATGLIGALVARLPESVVVPVLVFVGMEMADQAMQASDRRHLKALALALIPVMANLVNIQVSGLLAAAGVNLGSLPEETRRGLLAMTMLGNGFIVTAMVWAAWLAWVLDRRMGRAAWACLAGAGMTLVGLMHSPFPDGRLFLPWQAGVPPLSHAVALGYLLLAMASVGMGRLQAEPSRDADRGGRAP